MLEYIIIFIGLILALFMWLIYKKIDQKKNNGDEIKSALDLERERKKDLSDLKQDVVSIITQKYTNIEKRFSEIQDAQQEVVDFRNLFTNKTERGQLGEEWLEDILKDAISSNHYKAQHTFSNGKRVDFFLNFGDTNSTEGIPIDSKFSWENYKKMEEAEDPNIKKQCAKDFAEDIKKHVNAVSEYVIEGETGPIALMFVAAEGVFRAIEKSPMDFRRKAREKNVVIVSPDTIFGPLRTYRLLIQNRKMYEMSSVLQKEVGILGEDVSRLIERFSNLGDRHEKITDDYRKLKISMDKVTSRSEKIKNLDLEKLPKK